MTSDLKGVFGDLTDSGFKAVLHLTLGTLEASRCGAEGVGSTSVSRFYFPQLNFVNVLCIGHLHNIYFKERKDFSVGVMFGKHRSRPVFSFCPGGNKWQVNTLIFRFEDFATDLKTAKKKLQVSP